jgi:hypothetical protein
MKRLALVLLAWPLSAVFAQEAEPAASIDPATRKQLMQLAWESRRSVLSTTDLESLPPHVDVVEAIADLAADNTWTAARQVYIATVLLNRLHVLHLDEGVLATPRGLEFLERIRRATARTTNTDRGYLDVHFAALRSLLGDSAGALEELEPWIEVESMRIEALRSYLNICSATQNLRAAWPAFARFDEEIAAGRCSEEDRARYLVTRAALLLVAGFLDAAGEALEQAKQIELDPCSSVYDWLASNLLHTEGDWLLMSERLDGAEQLGRWSMAAHEGQRRAQGQLIAALACVRRGGDSVGEGVRLLEDLAAGAIEKVGDRARTELAARALQAGDREGARAWLANCEDLSEPLAHETQLVARAWLGIADVERGRTPDHSLEALRTRLDERYEWILEQWDSTPAELGGSAFLQMTYRRDLAAALCGLELALQPGERGVERCLDRLLAAEVRGSTARRLKLSPRSFEDLRSQTVPEGGAMLAYLPAPMRSFAFVVTRERMFAEGLPSDTPLRPAIAAFREAVATRGGSEWEAALAQRAAPVLSWCFPARVRETLESFDEWVIVGRDLLVGLPFEALPWPGECGWLGCAKAVWDPPSMTVAAHYRLRARAACARELVVAAGVGVSMSDAERFGVADLPLSAAELERVGQAVASDETLVLSRATRDDLLHGELSRSRMAVVFAHGVLDSSRARPHGMLMASSANDASGAVFFDEVCASSDVLWLGSCGLYGGGSRRGDDGGHRMASAFLLAGAQAVVTSAGDLDLAATRDGAAAALEGLAAGESLAQATRRARRAIASNPRWAHPYYHAQLLVVGLGDERVPLTPRAPRWRLGLGAGVAIALGAAALALRTRRRAA